MVERTGINLPVVDLGWPPFPLLHGVRQLPRLLFP